MPTARATDNPIIVTPSSTASFSAAWALKRPGGVVLCTGLLLLVTASIVATSDAPPVTLPASDYADFVLVLDISCELVHGWELKHGRGCRYSEARPRRYRCSCGLLRKRGELRAALNDWRMRNPQEPVNGTENQ